MSTVTIVDGEYAESIPWQLERPYSDVAYSHSVDNLHAACGHAVWTGEVKPRLRVDGSIYGYERPYLLPDGVARCFNESGHNITVLCLACLDEARRMPDGNL